MVPTTGRHSLFTRLHEREGALNPRSTVAGATTATVFGRLCSKFQLIFKLGFEKAVAPVAVEPIPPVRFSPV